MHESDSKERSHILTSRKTTKILGGAVIGLSLISASQFIYREYSKRNEATQSSPVASIAELVNGRPRGPLESNKVWIETDNPAEDCIKNGIVTSTWPRRFFLPCVKENLNQAISSLLAETRRGEGHGVYASPSPALTFATPMAAIYYTAGKRTLVEGMLIDDVPRGWSAEDKEPRAFTPIESRIEQMGTIESNRVWTRSGGRY